MSNPVRIVIAVVVLGLAAAGIAVKTMNRSEPVEAAAAVESSQADRAAPEAAEVAVVASQGEVTPPPEAAEELTGDDEQDTCDVDDELCDVPQPESQAESSAGALDKEPDGDAEARPAAEEETEQPAGEESPDKKLPRVLDLGRGTCKACKKMLPILQGLQQEYEGRAVIEIIDLRDDPDAAKLYGLRLIPTQIFFDSDGEEVWRHEGFLPKDDIVKKLKELGAD